jgi:peptidoglycan hydrolase-like protein with peptidoglycan-binding domain
VDAREQVEARRHLPGQHNQDSHGNGTAAAKAYALDAFEQLYSAIVDEATAGDLVVSVHENGDFVLSSMDDDGRRVVVLDGLDSDRANSIADGLEWAANEEIPEGSENNPSTRLVDWEYFEDDIVIGYDASGDVSVRLPKSDSADPNNLDDFNVLDLGVEEAADLVEALRDMADRYDELSESTRATMAELRDQLVRKFNPDQPRVPGGEHGGRWVKSPGSAVSAVKDALKLAGRIDLDPGEELLGSAKVDGDSGGVRMALTERAGERMLRLGLGGEGFGRRNRDEGIPAWDGNPPREPLSKEDRGRLDTEFDDLDAEYDTASEARQQEISARQAEIREQLTTDDIGFNGTAKLDEYSTRRLIDRIGPAMDEAVEQHKAEEAAWDEFEALQATGNADPARLAELRERARADDWQRIVFVEGIVPGSAWGDVHFRVELDDPSEGPYVTLGVMPKGAAGGWGDDKDWEGRFDAVEWRRMSRLLDKFSTDTASRAYSPESGSAKSSEGPKGGQFALGGGRVGAAAKTAAGGKRPARQQPKKRTRPAKPAGPLGFDGKRGTGYGIKGGDPRVRTLQAVLTRLGMTDANGVRLGVNGKYGPRTTAAVKKLQKAMGVEATGKVTEDFIKQIANAKSLAELRPKKAAAAKKTTPKRKPTPKPAQRPDRQSERQQVKKRVRRSAGLHELENGICRTCPPPHILENGICTTC